MPSGASNSGKGDLDPKILQAENESLKEQIEVLREQADAFKRDLEDRPVVETPAALKEIAARAQADLQNAKERLEREARDARKFAAAELIGQLLPVLDHFQRAFDHLPDDLLEHDWVKGIGAVEEEFLRTLRAAGLQKIDALGQPLDPQRHEVLQVGPGAKDVVTEVFEDGYEFNGRVFRPAKVRVGDDSSAEA